MAGFEEASRLQSQAESQTLGRSHVGALPALTKWSIRRCCPANVEAIAYSIRGPFLGGLENFEPHPPLGRLTNAQPVGGQRASFAQCLPAFLLSAPCSIRGRAQPFSTSRTRAQRAVEFCRVTAMRRDTQSLSPVLHGRLTTHVALTQSPGTARTAIALLLRTYSTLHPVTGPCCWEHGHTKPPSRPNRTRYTRLAPRRCLILSPKL